MFMLGSLLAHLDPELKQPDRKSLHWNKKESVRNGYKSERVRNLRVKNASKHVNLSPFIL